MRRRTGLTRTSEATGRQAPINSNDDAQPRPIDALTHEQIEAVAEEYVTKQRSAKWWADWIIDKIQAAWCDGYNRGLADGLDRKKQTAP